MKFFNDYKLSTKLNICVCSAIFICFLTLGSYLIFKSYELGVLNTELQAQKQSIITTKTIEKEFEKVKQELTDIITFFLNAKELSLDTKEEYINLLKASFENNSHISGLYIIWEKDTEGYKNNKCNTILDKTSKNTTHPHLIKDGEIKMSCETPQNNLFNYKKIKKTKKTIISEPYILHVGRKEVLVVSIIKPMLDKEGKFLGVIASEINLDFLQKLLNQERKENTTSTLLSSKGIIIANTTHPKWINTNITKNNNRNRKLWKSITNTFINNKNKNALSAFRNVEMLNEEALVVITPLSFQNSNDKWYYYTALPKKLALSELNSNIKWLIIALIATLIIIISINIIFIQNVVTPRLHYLVESMKKIAQGKFNFEIKESQSKDELGELQNSAKSLHKDLKDLVENLEIKVNERTQELNESMYNLELANKHKDKFLSALSHELRTPLNSIMVFSDLLHDQVQGDLNEKQLQYISQIINNGEHLSEMINDLLDITRIESGKIQLNYENISINELLSTTISSMESQFKSKEIQILRSYDSNNHMIDIDIKRFKQILLNLLSNALKFTQEKGTITVGTEPLDDNSILIYVSDNGIGISENQLQLIFSEFYQVETQNDTKLQGLGLGLAITRRLVNLFGGEIYVESKLNKGSKFYFSLPTKQKTTQQNINTSLNLSKIPENKRILIMEHNKVNLGLILDLLHPYNHTIYNAENSTNILELIKSRNPDIVIIDLSIPDINYKELLSQIKTIEGLKDISIIIISSEINDKIISTYQKYNIKAFLDKPITRKKLLGTLSNLSN